MKRNSRPFFLKNNFCFIDLFTHTIISWYFLKNRSLVMVAVALYGSLAVLTLVQALQGKPLIKSPLNSTINYQKNE